MRYRLLGLMSVTILLNCKEVQKTETALQEPNQNILEKVATAYGYEHWNGVQEISFTFNVDRDSTHFQRSWIWSPKTNDVARISGTDTLRYNRATMDSVAFKTNAGFINDRYWVLAPFNLIWDQDNFTYELSEEVNAPISGTLHNKLTIVYGQEGGYTPGDAYDFYLDDAYLIREWVFRKGNQPEPSMTTTWENYTTIEGLTIVKDHKKAEGNFNLYIDNVRVKTGR